MRISDWSSDVCSSDLLAIGELAIVLDQSQPRVSRHVRILVEAGVVERRREGSWVFLRIAAEGPGAETIGQAEKWPFSVRETRVIAPDAWRSDSRRGGQECGSLYVTWCAPRYSSQKKK